MKYADKLKVTTTDVNTVTLRLSDAFPGCWTLVQLIRAGGAAVGDTNIPLLVDDGLGNWEVGMYTITRSNLLTRTSITSSSNDGAAVLFPAGVKTVSYAWDTAGSGTGGGGSPGADGKSLLNGTGAPAAGLGKDGDFYLDKTATTLYGPKASGAWPGSGVVLIGAAGNTIRNGSGAPASGLGNNGDFYIDTTASVIYGPKASGAWPGSGVSMAGGSGGAAGPDVLADATASFTIGTTHANQTIPVSSTAAVVVTIAPDSTTNLAIGTTVTLARKGTGGVSFQEGAGVTLRFSRSRSAYAVGSVIGVKKLAANDWQLTGEQL